jgi:hypothetical protein
MDKQDQLMRAMLDLTQGKDYSVCDILGALGSVVAGFIGSAPTEELRGLALKKFVRDLLAITTIMEEIDDDGRPTRAN